MTSKPLQVTGPSGQTLTITAEDDKAAIEIASAHHIVSESVDLEALRAWANDTDNLQLLDRLAEATEDLQAVDRKLRDHGFTDGDVFHRVSSLAAKVQAHEREKADMRRQWAEFKSAIHEEIKDLGRDGPLRDRIAILADRVRGGSKSEVKRLVKEVAKRGGVVLARHVSGDIEHVTLPETTVEKEADIYALAKATVESIESNLRAHGLTEGTVAERVSKVLGQQTLLHSLKIGAAAVAEAMDMPPTADPIAVLHDVLPALRSHATIAKLLHEAGFDNGCTVQNLTEALRPVAGLQSSVREQAMMLTGVSDALDDAGLDASEGSVVQRVRAIITALDQAEAQIEAAHDALDEDGETPRDEDLAGRIRVLAESVDQALNDREADRVLRRAGFTKGTIASRIHEVCGKLVAARESSRIGGARAIDALQEKLAKAEASEQQTRERMAKLGEEFKGLQERYHGALPKAKAFDGICTRLSDLGFHGDGSLVGQWVEAHHVLSNHAWERSKAAQGKPSSVMVAAAAAEVRKMLGDGASAAQRESVEILARASGADAPDMSDPARGVIWGINYAAREAARWGGKVLEVAVDAAAFEKVRAEVLYAVGESEADALSGHVLWRGIRLVNRAIDQERELESMAKLSKATNELAYEMRIPAGRPMHEVPEVARKRLANVTIKADMLDTLSAMMERDGYEGGATAPNVTGMLADARAGREAGAFRETALADIRRLQSDLEFAERYIDGIRHERNVLTDRLGEMKDALNGEGYTTDNHLGLLMEALAHAKLGRAFRDLEAQILRLRELHDDTMGHGLGASDVADAVNAEVMEVRAEEPGSPAARRETAGVLATAIHLVRVHGWNLHDAMVDEAQRLRHRLDWMEYGGKPWSEAKRLVTKGVTFKGPAVKREARARFPMADKLMNHDAGQHVDVRSPGPTPPHQRDNASCPVNQPNFGGHPATAVPCTCARFEGEFGDGVTVKPGDVMPEKMVDASASCGGDVEDGLDQALAVAAEGMVSDDQIAHSYDEILAAIEARLDKLGNHDPIRAASGARDRMLAVIDVAKQVGRGEITAEAGRAAMMAAGYEPQLADLVTFTIEHDEEEREREPAPHGWAWMSDAVAPFVCGLVKLGHDRDEKALIVYNEDEATYRHVIIEGRIPVHVQEAAYSEFIRIRGQELPF